jgi:hypothetical protein
MNVLIKRLGQPPVIEEIATGLATGLEAMQAIVGGYIQSVPLGAFVESLEGVDLWCNEEGKLADGWGERINFFLPPGATKQSASDAVVGDVFFCSVNDDGDEIAPTSEQITKVCEVFGWTSP